MENSKKINNSDPKEAVSSPDDFNSNEKIAKFLLNYIAHKNVVFTYVHSYGGYPGGKSENYFNEGDVRGTLNYAIVHTIEFFNKDLSRVRSEKTIIGAFNKIAGNEMIDVYNKQYKVKKRTVVSNGECHPPTFKNSDDERLASEGDSGTETIFKKELAARLSKAISTLEPIEQRVIKMKMDGHSDEDMAGILRTTKREIMTVLIRAKRKISNDKELEALCA